MIRLIISIIFLGGLGDLCGQFVFNGSARRIDTTGCYQLTGTDNFESGSIWHTDKIDLEPDNGFAWREMAAARFERGEEPLAELASAEASFTVGDYSNALNFAERARRSLPRNTVAYRRADDIVNFAGNEVRERMQRAGRRS